MTNKLKIMILGVLLGCSTEGVVKKQGSDVVEISSGPIRRTGSVDLDGGSSDAFVSPDVLTMPVDTFKAIDTTLQKDVLAPKDTFISKDTLVQTDTQTKLDSLVSSDTTFNPWDNLCIIPPDYMSEETMANAPDMSNGECVEILPYDVVLARSNIEERQSCELIKSNGGCEHPYASIRYKKCGFCKVTCGYC